MNAKKQNARPTIAYLAPEVVVGPTPTSLWSGIEAGARERDLNLIAFPGGNIHSRLRGQANVIYNLITPETFAGLVTWAAALQHLVDQNETMSEEELSALHARYHPLPIVTLSKAVPGYPVVLAESGQGMRDAIAHLIEVHSIRRIAFIRGPEGHPAAEVRYRAYLDTLVDYGIGVNADLVTPPGRYSRERGEQAVDLFFDQRDLRPKEDIEAIIAASDLFALTAMEALQRRSVRVPEDVAVVGFNDSIEARSASPSITSVAVPFREQGMKAVDVLERMLEGESVPDETIIPSRLAIHQSCGCLDATAAQAGTFLPRAGKGVSLKKAFVTRREIIVQEMVRAMDIPEKPAWAESVLDGFILDLGESQPGEFLAALREVLRRAPLADRTSPAWQNVLSVLQRHAVSYVDPQKGVLLIGQARAMLWETTSRALAQLQFQAEKRIQTLQAINSDLVATFEVEGLMDVLAESLPRLGIPSCYLALYEDPQPYEYPQPAPEWSRLILAYDESGRVLLEPRGNRFPTQHILPEGMLPAHRRYTMMVQALHFQDAQIGFVLFEVGSQDWSVYEVLRGEIASALQGALLVQARREAEAALVRERDFMSTLLNSSPDYIFFKDRESRFIMTNDAHAQQLLGFNSAREVTGKTDFDIFARAEAQRFYEEEQRIMETDQPVIGREWSLHSSTTGELVWLSEHKVPIRDETGRVIGLLGISRDVTRLKQAASEQERLLTTLERHSVQFQAAAEVSHAASSVLDPEELIQQAVDLIRERFDLYYVGLFLIDRGGSASEPGGKWAVLHAGTGEAGRGMLEQGHKLEIGGTSMVGWCVANKQARIALDVGEEAVRFDNPFLPETHSELALPLVSRGEVIGVLTIQSTQRAAFSEEDIRVLQTMADQLANAITNAQLYDQAQQEIVERKRVEEALARQAQMLDAELERFFFVASHHLQEPLRTVVSYSQLLQQRYEGKLDEEADEIISYAIGGAARIRTLINDMLTFARVTTRGNAFESTDSSAILSRVLNNLRAAIEETGTEITYDPLPTVVVDSAQLTQVFQHILINAIQFRGDRPLKVHVGAKRGEGEWVFSIKDNGIGVEPQYLDRIFQIFERLHSDWEYQGTGIGLAICKKIIERHGGRIWAESEPGVGSMFFFTIPEP